MIFTASHSGWERLVWHSFLHAHMDYKGCTKNPNISVSLWSEPHPGYQRLTVSKMFVFLCTPFSSIHVWTVNNIFCDELVKSRKLCIKLFVFLMFKAGWIKRFHFRVSHEQQDTPVHYRCYCPSTTHKQSCNCRILNIS